MEANYTFSSLSEKLKTDVIGKWHPEGRKGNDGSPGNTIEDLLGVEENNLKLPDWGDIELKTHVTKSKSLLTLIHREPQPQASIPSLLKSLGWRHKLAGDKYPEDEKSFRSTTKANLSSVRGFSIELKDERISFIFNPEEVALSTIDKTGIYPTYGDWLADIESRSLHYSKVLPVFWDKQYILDELKGKLDNTLFILAQTKKIDGVKHFKYYSATFFKGFIPEKLDSLFDEHALFVDFDARTRHNHGTKFRVNVNSVTELFDEAKQIIE